MPNISLKTKYKTFKRIALVNFKNMTGQSFLLMYSCTGNKDGGTREMTRAYTHLLPF